MIRAVVERATWEHAPDDWPITHPGQPIPPPPYELQEWWDFLRYGLPPNAGGMRDQPLGWMDRCQTLDAYYRAWAAWLSGNKGPMWRKEHPEQAELALWLRESGYGE